LTIICPETSLIFAQENGLVSQTIKYIQPEAEEVYFVWGINGWRVVHENLRTPETTIKDKIMYTPMECMYDTFVAQIQVPFGATVDYGFLITKKNGTPVKIWEANGAQDYHTKVLKECVIEIHSTQTLSPSKKSQTILIISICLIIGIILFFVNYILFKPALHTRYKAIFKDILKVAVATVLLFVIIECLIKGIYYLRNSAVDYIPIPYMIGYIYGPIPPWLDGLRLLEPDNDLIWKNRSNIQRKYIDIFSPVQLARERTSLLRQFFPVIPASLKGNSTWELSLNSEGFRDNEFPETKGSSSFRIICMGDSWTFGANVDQEQAYPQQLRALLKQKFPAAELEVFNLGVLGYSSYQVLELLKRKAIDIDPDVVIIGAAWNDATKQQYYDKDVPEQKQKFTKMSKSNRVLNKIESYKLLRYLVQVLKYKPVSMSDFLGWAVNLESDPNRYVPYEKGMTDWQNLRYRTRVSPEDYEKNILEIIELVRNREATVILLYNELSPDSPYRSILKKISKEEDVPMVDSRALIAEAKRKIENNLEKELGLLPPTDRQTLKNAEVKVIFRVYLGDHYVPKSVYITGAHSKLGNLVPNRIEMYDNGMYGDQKAGDSVWSYSATFPIGTKLVYVYTNSGREGKWEGLDVPEIRGFIVKPIHNEGEIYRPIETFGQFIMQADGWHTNVVGYKLIADALFEVLMDNDKMQHFLSASNRLAHE
jgi:lysophospholipase L1-like esterase